MIQIYIIIDFHPQLRIVFKNRKKWSLIIHENEYGIFEFVYNVRVYKIVKFQY